MKKVVVAAVVVAAVVVASLAGCRAIVGIDDLGVDQPNGNNPPNGSSGSGGGNARRESCGAGDPQQCVPCCKQNAKSYEDAFQNGPVECLCGAPNRPCLDCSDTQCIDNVLKRDNGCTPQCHGQKECEDVLDCLKACK